MRWLMTLGERTRADVPRFAECPAPGQARALALADDFGQLFYVLREWRQVYGEELTAWAKQVQADDISTLPADLIAAWEWEADVIRLDTERGGYVRVSDYATCRYARAPASAPAPTPSCGPPRPDQP